MAILVLLTPSLNSSSSRATFYGERGAGVCRCLSFSAKFNRLAEPLSQRIAKWEFARPYTRLNSFLANELGPKGRSTLFLGTGRMNRTTSASGPPHDSYHLPSRLRFARDTTHVRHSPGTN